MFKEENVNVLDPLDTFYSQPLYFSYSSLKLLMYSPVSYAKKYIYKDYEERMEEHLIRGKVIHCLALSRKLFEELFLVSPVNLPTGNSKKLVDHIFKLHSEVGDRFGVTKDLFFYRTAILDYLKKIDLHQKLADDKKVIGVVPRTGDEKRIEKVITEETDNYFEYLKKKGTRDVIDQETLDYCEKGAEALLNHSTVRKLLGMDGLLGTESNKIVVNETEICLDLRGRKYGLKGILDNLVIDEDKRTITVNDVKTTSKSLAAFKESVEYYQYSMQAAIYTVLAYAHCRKLVEMGYTVHFNFVVLDSNHTVFVFPVKEQTLAKWIGELGRTLKKAEFHLENKEFTYPYELAKGDVAL